jgi:hypothetical protein
MKVWKSKAKSGEDQNSVLIDEFIDDSGIRIDRWFSSADTYIHLSSDKARELHEKLGVVLQEME